MVPLRCAGRGERYGEAAPPMAAGASQGEPPMTKEEMEAMLREQQASGCTPEEARQKMGRSARPRRMAQCATEPTPEAPHPYSQREIAEWLVGQAPVRTKDDMERCLRYQAQTGCSPQEARAAVLGGVPIRYDAGLPSGSNPFIPGGAGSSSGYAPRSQSTYTGDAAGAIAWGREQDSTHQRRLKEQDADRLKMHKLAHEFGVPVTVAGMAMQMAERGEAYSAEDGVRKIIDRAKNQQLFSCEVSGLPLSITTMKG
jgi:hypothetical protein